MGKPAFCICKNEGADQLRDNGAGDQYLYFRSIDSAILLLPKSDISRLKPYLEVVQPMTCRTWSVNLMTGFIVTQLIQFV